MLSPENRACARVKFVSRWPTAPPALRSSETRQSAIDKVSDQVGASPSPSSPTLSLTLSIPIPILSHTNQTHFLKELRSRIVSTAHMRDDKRLFAIKRRIELLRSPDRANA